MPKRGSKLLLGVVGAVIVLAAGAVAVYKLGFSGNSAPPEDQIRSLITTFTTDLNNGDGAGMAALFCDETKTRIPTSGNASTASRAAVGTAASSIADIRVTGDKASGTVTTTWSNAPFDTTSVSQSFVNEGGSWKMCETVPVALDKLTRLVG